MPDNDRIYKNLPPRYGIVLEQIYEGHFSQEKIAYDLMGKLGKYLRQSGAGVIEAICQITPVLPVGPLVPASVNWNIVEQQLERTAREHVKNCQAHALLIKAGNPWCSLGGHARP